MNNNGYRIVVDAGHGGSDYGAIREGINEKDITLEVKKAKGKELRTCLEEQLIGVIKKMIKIMSAVIPLSINNFLR